MYLYSLSPQKKEEKKAYCIKKIDAHIPTKEELQADFGVRKEFKNFVGKIIPHGQQQQNEKQEQETKQMSEPRQEATEPLEKATDMLLISKENIQPDESQVTVVAVKKEVKEVKEKVSEDQVVPLPKPEAAPREESPFMQNVQDVENGEQKIVSPNFKIIEENYHKEAEKVSQEKKSKSSFFWEKSHLDEKQQKVLDELIDATSNFEEEKLRTVIENVAALRQENEENFAVDAPLNLEIKKNLLGSISARFAYGKNKNIIGTLQLLDIFGIELAKEDFTVVPDEVLKSEEMKEVIEKYLVSFAKEYEDAPADIERKISLFANCGLVSLHEIFEMPAMQEIVEKNLLKFAAENKRSVQTVNHKIQQYALAGFCRSKEIKAMPRMKEIFEVEVLHMIEKHLDRIEMIARKISEYENLGFISRKELRANERIQTVIEKYLSGYANANVGHQRKIMQRINEYFELGLISAQDKEAYLGVAKGSKHNFV